jgi:asparagine synthase (glutamine-hydrolysing)
MCGIVGIFEIKDQAQELRTRALEMSKKIRHRGPDWSGFFVGERAIIAHVRLEFVDPASVKQPLYNK